jgi:thioester reductase-like protein
MGHFITGATGFIGRHLIDRLVARGEPIWALVRRGSRAKFDRLLREWGDAGRLVVPVEGDLQQEYLGVAASERAALRGRIRHFYHLGALYDLGAAAADLERANVLGTRTALQFAQDIEAGCFHLVSSIAVAGRYRGTFTESMFSEATAPSTSRRHWCAPPAASRGACTGRVWSLAIRAAAPWTRSMARTISSS